MRILLKGSRGADRPTTGSSPPGRTGYLAKCWAPDGGQLVFLADRMLEVPHMRSRLKGLFWRAMDQVMPEGPPVLLSWLVVILLLADAFVALSRW